MRKSQESKKNIYSQDQQSGNYPQNRQRHNNFINTPNPYQQPQYHYYGQQPQYYPPPQYYNYHPHYPQYPQYPQYQYSQIPPAPFPQNQQYHPPLFDPRTQKIKTPERIPKKQEQHSSKKQESSKKSIKNQENSNSQFSNSPSESEDEQQLYRKTKMIKKFRDPVMDTPTEIKKWVEARKKNYPKANPDNEKNSNKDIEKEMSILQKKLRKKILLVSSNPKNIMKKIKNMDILRRIVSGGKFKGNNFIKKKQSNIRKNILKELKTRKEGLISSQKNGQIKQRNQKIYQEEMEKQQNSNSEAEQKPIPKEQPHQLQLEIQTKIQPKQNPNKNTRNEKLTPSDMIKHLQQKQKEDEEYFSKILDYKTNSLNYKYAAKALQTNFILEDIFTQSSVLLQAIRYIVKNNFFEKNQNQ